MDQSWLKLLPATLREKVAGRAYLQNVVNNTVWQFGDQVIRMAVGLVIGIWLARYLGPGDFGLLSYALAFVALFTAIANLGLEDILVRDLVRNNQDRQEILGTAFFLRLVSGTISFAAALVAIFLLRPADGTSHWLIGIIAAGTLFQGFYVIECWFHSQVQAKYAVIAKNITFLLCSLAKIILILRGAPLLAFAWVALVEVGLGAMGLIAAYLFKENSISLWRVRAKRAKLLLKDSWPLMLSSIVIMIYLRIDQIMLGEIAGHEEVGIYSVAVRMAEVWYFIPMAIYWSVLPAIVEAKAQSEQLFYARLQQLYNLVTLSAYAVVLPVTLLGQWLVPLLFGEDYSRAGLMLAVLIWSNIFTSLEMARSSFLTVMNWTRLYLLTVSLGCLLNIALNAWLIPRYGGMGAVVASLAAYWFAAHGSCFLFKPLRPTGMMLTRAIIYPKIW